MKKKIMTAVGLGATLWYLPKALHKLGLHPDYDMGIMDLEGKRALIVTTSQAVLGNSGKPTGVYASEMTIPYYVFKDAEMRVDLASIEGGRIPIEPFSLQYPLVTQADRRFKKDRLFQHKAQHSLAIHNVDFTAYDLIFIAGGWGAAYDLGQSDILGEKLTQAYAKGIVIGAVCHGALGLIKAKDINGDPLLKGKVVTGVTNKQIRELGVKDTPLHPETELKRLGANYLSVHGLQDVFANLVVADHHLVTGQNQNAGAEVATRMLIMLKNQKNRES